MAMSDGSGGVPAHFDAVPGTDKRGVSRRSVLLGGAALLAGAGLMKPARAVAASPTAGGHTPSDFTLLGLDQDEVEELEAEFGADLATDEANREAE